MIPKAGKVQTPASYGAVRPRGDYWPLNFDTGLYFVNKVYPTIQGEGRLAGTPMTIVRLQGCPVGCVWCDTPETWHPPTYASSGLIRVGNLVEKVAALPPRWALVTGGEPCWHDLHRLTVGLHYAGVKTALETSGVYQITGEWNYITISPKPGGKLPLVLQNIPQADELKWVIGKQSDVDYVVEQYRNYISAGLIEAVMKPVFSLQPVSTSEKATRLCLNTLMKYPEWRLSLQLHKYLDIA